MRYFRLGTDCFLVSGKDNSAIYDVHGCKVFLLDREAHNLLLRCERNEPLGEEMAESETSFLVQLQERGLGFFDSEPAYIDKFRLHQPIKFKSLGMQPPEFLRVDWAITNKCDLKCRFCGREDETVSWQSCQTCLRRDKVIDYEWKPDDIELFVNQIDWLGARVLHIRGGNPLLNFNYLREIIQSVRNTSLNLIITVPGTGLDATELIDICSGGQVSINIVIQGLNAEISDAIYGCDGVWEQQLILINALTEAKLPFMVTSLFSQASLLQRQEVLDFIRGCSGVGYSIAEAHFIDEIGEGFRLLHVGANNKPLTPWQSVEEFFYRTQFNNCMRGRFEIGSDGNLRLCAGNHHIIGNIAAEGFRKVISKTRLYDGWELNKDKVHPCKHCVLRYACTDCSVFEFKGENNSIIKAGYCPYHPNRNSLDDYIKDCSSDEEFISTLRIHYSHM